MTTIARPHRLPGTLGVIGCTAVLALGLASTAGTASATAGAPAPAAGGGSWTSIGPSNIGGRVTGGGEGSSTGLTPRNSPLPLP